jgi:hypothetical protein
MLKHPTKLRQRLALKGNPPAWLEKVEAQLLNPPPKVPRRKQQRKARLPARLQPLNRTR